MPTCVNHPATEETRPCANCARTFCDHCLVEIMGGQLCVECKEVALEDVFQRRALHPLALISLVVPVAGYFLCLIPITAPIGLWLGRRVLRDLAVQPHLTGRSLALAGMVVAGGTLGTFLLAVATTILLRIT